jgi:hypothetical protein
VACNDITTSTNHLLEISANNTGPAKIEHITTTGTTRDLAISSTGEVNITSNKDINLTTNSGGDITLTSSASCNVIAGSFFQASSSFGPNIGLIGTTNSGRVEIQATQGLFFTGAALQSGTSGGNSGQHLVIILNGTVYKIRLEFP